MNDSEIVPRGGEQRAMAPVAQFGELTVQALVDRKRKILEVMNAVMSEGPNGHYGKIPGCGDKPTLFKSGAEVLATTFGLAPRFVVIQTDLPGGHREYRVTCTLAHIATGANCGEGVGCCSTMESKYRYRGGSRKCPECGKEAIIKGKAEYGGGWLCFQKKGGCGTKWPDGAAAIEKQETGKIDNPDPADQYNTVLKMAKKRAQVDATLTAVGASDLLTQDLEDLPAASPVIQADPPPTKAREDKAEDAPPDADPLAPVNFNRAGTLRDLKRFCAEGGGLSQVKKAAAALGYNGRGMDSLTDSELDALYGAVFSNPAA